MKRAVLLLWVGPTLLAICGCTEMSPEDREFYGRGWIHPGELDKERPTQMPSHPETTGSLGGAPAAITAEERAAASNGGWTPDGY